MIESVKINMEKKFAEFLEEQIEIILADLTKKEPYLYQSTYKQEHEQKIIYYGIILESLKQKEYVGFGGF